MENIEYYPPVVKVILVAVERGFEGSGGNEGIGAPGWG